MTLLRERAYGVHTAASEAVTAGKNLPLVGICSGIGGTHHGSYAHLTNNHLIEATKKTGNIIAEAMK